MGQEHRNVGIFDHIDITSLDTNKFFNVGMIHTKGLHISTPPPVLSDGIGILRKKVHKTSRTAGFTTGTIDRFARRSQDRKIMTATATVFIGQRFASYGFVYFIDGIIFYGHHIAIIQRGCNIFTTGAMHNPSAGYKFEIFQYGKEFSCPFFLQFLTIFNRG